MLPQDEQAIIRQGSGGILSGLKAMDHLRYDSAWAPSAEQVLSFRPQSTVGNRQTEPAEESCLENANSLDCSCSWP